MPSRVFKSRERSSKFRDAKLIIIASEGTQTEPKYFSDLAANDAFQNPKVHIVVLERESTDSSPEHVIRNLDKFKRVYKLNKYDELWLVIDVDRWTSEMLSNISTQCRQKNYFLAVSNPCFELWLLLHVKSLDLCTQAEIKEFLENKKIGRRTRLERELLSLLGVYNKNLLDTSPFIPNVSAAIERAKKMDTLPDDRWPNHLCTRVYLLRRYAVGSDC